LAAAGIRREGELIVVTEDNEVFALDAQSGKQIWERALGSPVQRSALPCGNISPLGVTGAPVIDEQRDALSRRGGHARQWAATRNFRAFSRRRLD